MWRDYGDFGFPISTLFWGTVIIVALVAACLLVGNAIGRSRNQGRLDGTPNEGHTKDPKSRFDPTSFDKTVADLWRKTDQTSGQREAIKKRRKGA